MAVPEVVAWEDIKDFKFAGCDETFGDIYIDKVIESVRNELILCRTITEQTNLCPCKSR